MTTKALAALAAATFALSACAWQEHTDESIVTRSITPGPGSSTEPKTVVTDTITKTTGLKGQAPASTATKVTTTTITPVGSTSSTTSKVEGKMISPDSEPQPIIQPGTLPAR